MSDTQPVINFQQGNIAEIESDCIVLGHMEGCAIADSPANAIDQALGDDIRQAMETGDFTGELGTTLLLYTQNKVAAPRVLLVGLGLAEAFTAAESRIAAATAYNALAKMKEVHHYTMAVLGEEIVGDSTAVQMVAEGTLMAAYQVPQYRRQNEATGPAKCTVVGTEAIAEGLAQGTRIAQAVVLARDLTNEPANILYPTEMAARAKTMAERCNLQCTILGEAEMTTEGMGLLLAVSQGSIREAQMVILEHAPPGMEQEPPIILVGKGVTFDTGGISLKKNDGMWLMKGDMAGAATVIATMQAIAEMNISRRVIGVAPCVENMPDATAYRPGDILTGITGKTTEIISTDAEGRLILADALGYIARYEPCAVVDLATLTGSVVVALGPLAAGLFSNDDGLRDQLLAASEQSGERLWPLPLYDEYKDAIRSDMAEVKNSGGRAGGVGTSAKFIEHFTEGYPWAHLDIAGVSWGQKPVNPFTPKGATGFGVRLLMNFVENYR